MPDRPRPDTRCVCGHVVLRFSWFCPACGRAQVWRDTHRITGAECASCKWMVSDKASFCPWCGDDLYEAGVSSEVPLKEPKGFRFDARCDHGCGGGVQYPMAFCPWCGKAQSWNEDNRFEGTCPRCARGVDDWMDTCLWCGEDATGRDLIAPALSEVRRLLKISGVANWGYRVLLRPGVSGVDPQYPKVVELEQRYVIEPRVAARPRPRKEIQWTMLVGLIVHELGHSFLFHNWAWTRTPRFRRAFGEVDKAYRAMDDTWVYFERREVATSPADHVTAYAAKHPQEDFAETFRFYVTRQRRLRDLFAELGRKRKGVVVYEKFLLIHDYIRSLRGWT